MGRINAVLDERIDYGFEGGARYKTNVGENSNGFFERDSEWKYGKHEYEASFGNIQDDDRDFIISVFHICRGKRHDFLFYDWNDRYIENQLLICGTVGTLEPIQLYKKYEGFGEAYTIRPIQALKTVTLLDENGDPVAGDWDLGTGIFTPEAAWGEGPYSVSAEFYVWVHFDDDYNPMTINSWQANTARVRLVESPMEFTCTNVPESWDGGEV